MEILKLKNMFKKLHWENLIADWRQSQSIRRQNNEDFLPEKREKKKWRENGVEKLFEKQWPEIPPNLLKANFTDSRE